MKILITGAGGYIGSMLTELFLDYGYTVTCFDNFFFNHGELTRKLFSRPNCIFYNEDVTNWSLNLIKSVQESDVIIPLAALVGAPLCDRHEHEAIKVNEDWFYELLPFLSKQLVIYPNTNSGYGSAGDEICTEETPTNPLSLYASTKENAEKAVLSYHNSIVFRLATVFGVSHRPRYDLLVNNLIKVALWERNILLFDGHFKRNYIHIKDIVRAFDHAIKFQNNMVGNVYNLGNDEINTTKKELVKKICDATDATFSETDTVTDPDKRDYIVSSKKLYKTGYSPLYDLDYGISEMINHYKTNKAPDALCRNY